ncbi:hypothetical protein KI655_08850 [Vibrio sp. D404a]|uniref:hypothetical protein n=1 Tax=unclassified Vibrio TaxID=2614977 RepID=UPI002552D776|nr:MULTISPECIES: hypothetical protein [unclassified Vibrio]MDK9737408.1 hypothetical protein [Vibrio sp. D404a]MDK9797916.1 hypothetical protein [Vibrio sp. D449a]
MKLLASLLTTTAITASIWGALQVQPAIAKIGPMAATDTSAADTSVTRESSFDAAFDINQPGALIGVTKTVALSSVPQVWVSFYEQVEAGTNDKLSAANVVGNEVVVLYQEITPDFSEAKITVGFRQKASSDVKPNARFSSLNKAVSLLNKGKHDDMTLTSAWEMIDYRRDVEAVLERHYLNQHGLPDSSELYVYYK